MPAKLNWTRILLGGLLAGLVLNVFDFLVNGVLLSKDWTDAMKALNKPEMGGAQIAAFNIVDFLIGIFAVWLFAALRPIYGGGSAIRAGFAVWFIGYLLASVAPVVTDVFPVKIMAITVAVGLVQSIVSTYAGSRVYRD